MARFAFEALGIERTEGEPDTRQTKANEKKPRTMKKLLAVAGLGAAITLGSLVGAGTANAATYEDSQYVACVAQDGLYNSNGPSFQASFGRQIANDISLGIRDPLQERDWVYYNTPGEIGVTDANWLVNCATQIYLGFGPWDSNGGGNSLA